MKLRLIAFLGLLVTVGAVWAFVPGDLLSFDSVKAHRAWLQETFQRSPVVTVVLYFLFYVLVTGLSLPIATVVSLAGGVLFGFLLGTVIVSFASTIGATLSFLLSRYLLRDFITERYSRQMSKINAGIASEGLFYLFALRLVPLFPFYLINLLMGLTTMKTRSFFWVSQLGMLPGTAAYLFAGAEIGRIEGMEEVLSFRFLLACTIIGVLPFLGKKLVRLMRGQNHEAVVTR